MHPISCAYSESASAARHQEGQYLRYNSICNTLLAQHTGIRAADMYVSILFK
jgi:hypothetical protein